MTALHIVNKAHPGHDALASCLAHCRAGDALLLTEDGVYGATAAVWGGLAAAPAGLALYVLAADLEARGLERRLAAGFERVDYEGFVRLAAAHAPVVSWF